MICVYPADCTDFSTNGNGALSPLSANVTETLNGEYELELIHPIDEAGKWQRLVEGCILRAPVPAAMTPRVNFTAPGDDNRTEVWRVNTDFSGAETRKGTLRLRSGPGTKYKVLATYKNGSFVQVIAKTSSSWYEVTAPDGKHGYMSTTYLVLDHTEGSASEATSSVVESRQLRDQPFRIYRVVPELDKITVYARHVFYDLLDNMIKSYKPSSSAVGASVVQTISSSCLSEHDFTFYSDLDSRAEDVEFENCNPVDALLGEGGVVEKYTGELTRDWWDVYVVKRVGQDSNVQIRQAKNLLGISYDIDLTDVVTRIMPTGEDADGNVLYLPELFLDSPLIGSYTHPKWIHLAVSEAKEKTDGDDKKTKEQCYAEMRSQAQAQFDAGCDTPTVTLTIAVAANSTLGAAGQLNGVVNVPITSPVETTLQIQWSKVNTGATGAGTYVLTLYAPGGTVFTNGLANDTDEITINAQYFYGTTDYTANTKAQFLWQKYESGEWVTVKAEATGANGNTLTVHAADVVGSASYRCRARYNSGSVYCYDTITIIDKTDNYQADIDSTAGDVFKNTVGQTCLICRLWQNGAEVDPLKSTTYSATAPSSPAAGDFYYKIASNSPTTALMRYSGSAWVDVTDDADYKHEKTYTWYRRDKDGNPMDSGAAFATGKVIYVDGDDVTVKTVFVCEVE